VSRGLGKLQREVLVIVDADHRHRRTIRSLTRRIHGERFTDAQRRSVARAVATLADRGLVETYRSGETSVRPGGRNTGLTDAVLAVETAARRNPPTINRAASKR
jgi:hypothetical protein